MDNKMDKRVVTRVTAEEYNRLLKIHKKYGFKSVYQMLRCMVSLFAEHIEPQHEEDEPLTLEDEITDMFTELRDSQAPKYVKHVRPRNRTVYEQESKVY